MLFRSRRAFLGKNLYSLGACFVAFQKKETEQGIHARPAGMFVKEAAAFSSKVTISKDGKEVDAKRILGVMGLGVKKDQEIVLRADGDDEDAAIEKLSAFLQENL